MSDSLIVWEGELVLYVWNPKKREDLPTGMVVRRRVFNCVNPLVVWHDKMTLLSMNLVLVNEFGKIDVLLA